jgi:hypothetical protein
MVMGMNRKMANFLYGLTYWESALSSNVTYQQIGKKLHAFKPDLAEMHSNSRPLLPY